MRKLIAGLLISLSLYGCGDYEEYNVPVVELGQNDVSELIKITALNFSCGFYGRYSSESDSPIVYEKYLNNARLTLDLLRNSTHKGKKISENKNSIEFLDGLEAKIANAMISDLDNGLSSLQEFLGNAGFRDCAEVGAITTRTLDKFLIYKQ